jgi:hypothetical protein
MTIAILITMGLAAVVIQRNVSDLRSFSKLIDRKEISRVTNSGSETPFLTNGICEPLRSFNKVVIVNLDGYLELNSDDVEVLRLTDENEGIRLVVNEERQMILYFADPNSANYVTGLELFPPISEFGGKGEIGGQAATRYELEIRLFKIQNQNRQNLIIQTKVTEPITFSQYNVVSDVQSSALACSGSGAIGTTSFDNELNAKFSTAIYGEESLGVVRNYRLHIMYIFAVYGCAFFLMRIWQSRNDPI